MGGTSIKYLTSRLQAVGRQDLLAAVARGEITTYTAAEAAGLIQRPQNKGGGNPGPTKRRAYALRRLSSATTPSSDIDTCGLTYGELQELWLGCGDNGSLFSGEEELRAAWIRARGVVMRIWANNGRRPQAWWYFDAPDLGLTWPGYDRQQSYLYEHNALSESERVELERFWRREFEQAQAADFTMNTGAEVLHGVRARRAHYAWADIPSALIEAWANGRRRRGRRLSTADSTARSTAWSTASSTDPSTNPSTSESTSESTGALVEEAAATK